MPASCCCCWSWTQCLNLTTDHLLGWCCCSWTQRLNLKTDDLPAWCCCSWTQCLNLKTDHPTWVVHSIKGFYPEEELWTRTLLHCLIQSLSKQASFLHSSLFPLIATSCPPRNHPSCSPRIQREITKFAKVWLLLLKAATLSRKQTCCKTKIFTWSTAAAAAAASSSSWLQAAPLATDHLLEAGQGNPVNL